MLKELTIADETSRILREKLLTTEAALVLSPPTGQTVLLVTARHTPALEFRMTLRRETDQLPDVVLVVDGIPRDAEGGIDPAWLQDGLRGGSAHTHVAPATDLERGLAAIWAEVLDVPEVGVEDDFVDLGGDSFAAVEIIHRTEEECGLGTLASDLYQAGTIRALLASAGDSSGDGAAR
ncbi:phosphopantetheine-binding protein [Streptacidiphilus cavernicola]|uniref:Phosphopantetheine-binding protein n=1 Tax=Streptacidiphilus cavernicola TaxID=3342716 RepID=A0ABV6VZW6_9ACTN